ncbi:MFS transporter [Clostridium chrysemydis]|uniref:MFS transporter n=1 Tax=Clostridium chrysemydis TaxID=2665504 RepID=UPI001883DC77|nr:MFS transporter [Clostridium chrysemydis]
MEKKKGKEKLLMIMFLLGIFIGAMDTGIVSPARNVIANGLNITESASIWMITIYTLAYAVSMPISGKLSDIFGKKKLFTFSIVLFGIGSILCGLSDYFGGYSMLIIARIIQAIGGGGIMPIATAYIGDSFPEEKRGTALGLVGATYGIATTLGPTIGSGILSIFGDSNWGVLFFINVPICIVALLISAKVKVVEVEKEKRKMDIKGSVVISLMILSLMYGVTNLNFHDFLNSLKSLDVYPYLIVFVILLPVFIYTEKKAEDPVMNLNYFKTKDIAITLVLSFLVGAGLMGIVFMPQFAENTLKIQVGSGGYFVTLMAIFSGVAAPFGGKLIDKYSAKLILLLGFGSTIIGSLILGLYVAQSNSQAGLIIGLAFMGLGMGFTMGTPLNYLMQSFVDKNETASAQSTLSLVRSIGVAVSPNILVNFIAEAGTKVPSKLMEVMPQIPGMNGNAFSGGNIPESALNSLKSANVTNIVETMKNFSSTMMDSSKNAIESGIMHSAHGNVDPNIIFNNMKLDYLNKIEASRNTIESTYQQTMNSGYSHLFIAAAGIALVAFILTLFLSKKKSN